MSESTYDVIAVTIRVGLTDAPLNPRLDKAAYNRQLELIADYALSAALADGATLADVYELLWERFPVSMGGPRELADEDEMARVRWTLEEMRRLDACPGRPRVLDAMKAVVSTINIRAHRPVTAEVLARMDARPKPDKVYRHEVISDDELRHLFEQSLFEAFAAEDEQ